MNTYQDARDQLPAGAGGVVTFRLSGGGRLQRVLAHAGW